MSGIPAEPGPQAASRPPEPRVLRGLAAVEIALAVLFLALIFLGVLWQVLGRYAADLAWAGAGEIARYSLVGLTFVMVGYLIARNGQITVSVIDTIARGRAAIAVRLISAVLLTAICALLAYQAWVLVSTGFGRTTTVLQIPLGYLYILPLIGFVSGVISAIVRIFTAKYPEPDQITFEEAEAEA
ncbi:TRAP transporter small permease [Salinibacterium sp. SYSU T00001]|uniref:TRAP transporter small permease n=1 Tax=Homoserinimonas sedimenticola TaxID=2986805 RepID=UPI0022363BF0|nr:TRAP transporter small permease [Salinibacterium sedimenticola]MCW4385485.1 TRAP transporter small permease [Salinibacterium sedimenticola]